jgi:polar amino acid transport system ATP-binding protein/sulfate transport system ATP-binding protein
MTLEHSYGQTLLKVENVCLEYDGRPILRNVCAEIKNVTRPGITTGQIVGFLGPSGCGKTSLFRIIAGLDQPTSGRVTINGFDRPVEAGEVGVVAQSCTLFRHRTVFSNLLVGAMKKEPNEKIATEKVNEFLHEFDLLDKAKLYPAQLSGGQRQRCAIGQQILNSEHFLLLDEPFSGLDMVMEEKTCALLTRIANRDDLNTIIVVTHDVTAAVSIADHLWVMGRDTDAEGKKVPGARILKEYNLIERDLCWRPDIATSPVLTEFVREVKEGFRLC